MDKTEKNPELTKKRILNAATKRFAKNGFQKTSMNEIAKLAKVSKGSLFHHFQSKEELFFIVFSNNVDLEFKKLFDLFAKEGQGLFQKKENLFEDLRKYYDIFIAKPRDLDRLWLEGATESENNSKLRKMMIEKDNEIAAVLLEMVKDFKRRLGLLENYNENELLTLSKGLSTFFRGLYLERIIGKNKDELKNIWVQIMFSIYSSKK